MRIILLEATQKQIDAFNDKFGENSYDDFVKAKDRMKKAKQNLDIDYYINKVSPEDYKDMLLSLYDGDEIQAERRRRLEKGFEVRGEYKYFGRHGKWDVYQPLDYISSMDLGRNTGWCTTGRYGHPHNPDYTPSEEAAEEHWYDYTDEGFEFYYFLNPITHYGEWAFAVSQDMLPNKAVFVKNKVLRIASANFELYNDNDDLDYDQDVIKTFESINGFPKLEVDYEIIHETDNDGMLIEGGVLIKCYNTKIKTYSNKKITEIGKFAFELSDSITSIDLPNVTIIGTGAFRGCENLLSINLPNVEKIELSAFEGCSYLKSINLPNVTTIGDDAFHSCGYLESIDLPNVREIGEQTFIHCTALTSVKLPNLTYCDDTAFLGCKSLKTIYVDSTKIEQRNLPNCRGQIIDINTGEVLN